MALHDKNPEFAGIVQHIETLPGYNESILRDLLVHYLEEPIYQTARPAAHTPLSRYEVFIRNANLVRIRRDDSTTTLFGGTDFPFIVALQEATSPNFFSFRKGQAILKYMRLSTDFFSTGYFHSQGIRQECNSYFLHQTQEVPYYPTPCPIPTRRG